MLSDDARSTTCGRIIAAADELFSKDGVRATAVESVMRRAGVTDAEFAAVFNGKDDLVAAWLDERDRTWMAWLDERVRSLAPSPGGRVLALFDALAEWFGSDEFRGSAFINTAIEYPDPAHRIRIACRAHKVAFRRYIRQLLLDAHVASAERLAAEIELLAGGAITAAVVEDDGTAARVARAAAAKLLPP